MDTPVQSLGTIGSLGDMPDTTPQTTDYESIRKSEFSLTDFLKQTPEKIPNVEQKRDEPKELLPPTAPVPEPAVAPVPAPVPEPASEVVPAPVPEPVSEVVPAPVPEPAPEVVPSLAPAPAPISEPAPEVVPSLAPAPAPISEPAPEVVLAPEPAPTTNMVEMSSKDDTIPIIDTIPVQEPTPVLVPETKLEPSSPEDIYQDFESPVDDDDRDDDYIIDPEYLPEDDIYEQQQQEQEQELLPSVATAAMDKISKGEIFEGQPPITSFTDLLPMWAWALIFFLLGCAFVGILYMLFSQITPPTPAPTPVPTPTPTPTPAPTPTPTPTPTKPKPSTSRKLYCLIGEDEGRKVVIRVSDASLCRRTVMLTEEEYENSL